VNKFVLDASAILALLNRETGSEKVADKINDSIVNAVNLSEVVSKMNDYSIPNKGYKNYPFKIKFEYNSI
jgi:PIN domain nuclease of toxin-antitoxin system